MKFKGEMELMWDKRKNSKPFPKNPSKDKTDAHWICNYEGRRCEFISSPKRIYSAL